MIKKNLFPSFVISEQQFKMCSWKVFVCSWYNFSCAALSFLGGSTWTVLLLWHLWQAGQSKEITAIKCWEKFNFHTNYPHIVWHSVFFSVDFLYCATDRNTKASVYFLWECQFILFSFANTLCWFVKKKLICHFLVLCLFIDGAFKWFHVPLIWITS